MAELKCELALATLRALDTLGADLGLKDRSATLQHAACKPYQLIHLVISQSGLGGGQTRSEPDTCKLFANAPLFFENASVAHTANGGRECVQVIERDGNRWHPAQIPLALFWRDRRAVSNAWPAENRVPVRTTHVATNAG